MHSTSDGLSINQHFKSKYVKKFNSAIPISGIVMLIIVITSFTLLKKHARLDKLNQLYKEGLKVANARENNFSPAAEVAYYDSILALPANSEQSIFMAKCFKARDHLKLGEEQKTINIINVISHLCLVINRLKNKGNTR